MVAANHSADDENGGTVDKVEQRTRKISDKIRMRRKWVNKDRKRLYEKGEI